MERALDNATELTHAEDRRLLNIIGIVTDPDQPLPVFGKGWDPDFKQ